MLFLRFSVLHSLLGKGCRSIKVRPNFIKTLRVMKISVLLWLTAFLQVSAKSPAQEISLNLRAASLEAAFQAIERQTDYTFAYTDNQIRKAAPVNIKVVNQPTEKVLELLFRNQPLTYTIRNKIVVVSEKPAPASPVKNEPPAIQATYRLPPVSGVVLSTDGTPLPGATILVKSSKLSTITDTKGAFNINASAGDILVVSFVGYNSRELKVTEASFNGTLTIRLSQVEAQLQEVEIVVAYGKQKRASYTGSATVVNAEALEGKPRASFQESLQGNVPGLQSTSGTGQPGAAGNIRIRGTGSINANSSPLYVVDGVPINDMVPTVLAFSSNPLAAINPNDIESVTVLKDASATSIYGSRAANGVIMITTKSGAAGKTKLNIAAQEGFSEVALNSRNKLLTTSEMTELLVEGVINSNSTALANITTPEDAYDFLLSQGLKPDVNTNWYDVITQKGKFRQYTASASGGTEKNTYYASAGYYKQDAVTKGQGFERINARFRMKNTASKRLTFNMGFAPSYQKLSTIGNAGLGANPVRSLYRLVPWVAPYNADGSYSSIQYNPEIVRRENVYDTRIYSMLGDMGLELKLIDNLVAETKVAIDMSYTDDYRYWSPLWRDGMSMNGRGANYTTTLINWNITNLLKYNKRLGAFNLDATLGQEAQKRTRKRVSTQADDFAREGLYSLSSASKPYIAWSDMAATTLASYFLNTSFGYDSRFILNLTGRIDGSSMFGSAVRYAKFGSIGFAWNMHREEFMEPLHFIDELKLRSSFGINGNLYNEWYGVDGLYTTTAVYNNTPAYVLSQLENQRLTWEKNRPFDIGVDFSLFRNRLSGSFDYYKRVTSDLLLNAGVSATNGVTTQNRNIGSMENTGIELALTSKNIVATKPDGFAWNTSFNISTGKNTITSLGGVRNMISGVYNREIGGDFYQFYMPGWAGVDPATGNGLWYRNGEKNSVTTNYDSASSFKQGIARPKFFGSLTNTFEFKRFSLSFMLYVHWGGQVYDSWGSYTSSDGSAGVSDYGAIARVDYDNRWRKPGDIASSPKIVYGGSQTGLSSHVSSRFLYDASYIRLRDVTLSYHIPRNKVVQNATIYLRGNNLFTYVKDDKLRLDPETYVGGVLNQNLPIARQLLVGLDISL
jgi:TonB-linked outer membrane protein, SusC/RagA family